MSNLNFLKLIVPVFAVTVIYEMFAILIAVHTMRDPVRPITVSIFDTHIARKALANHCVLLISPLYLWIYYREYRNEAIIMILGIVLVIYGAMIGFTEKHPIAGTTVGKEYLINRLSLESPSDILILIGSLLYVISFLIICFRFKYLQGKKSPSQA